MSWVASLINPAQSQHLAPSGSGKSTVFTDAQVYEDGDTGPLRQKWSQAQAQPMDEEEEAARSPYWHVSYGH